MDKLKPVTIYTNTGTHWKLDNMKGVKRLNERYVFSREELEQVLTNMRKFISDRMTFDDAVIVHTLSQEYISKLLNE